MQPDTGNEKGSSAGEVLASSHGSMAWNSLEVIWTQNQICNMAGRRVELTTAQVDKIVFADRSMR